MTWRSRARSSSTRTPTTTTARARCSTARCARRSTPRTNGAGQRDPLRPAGRPDDDQPDLQPADDHAATTIDATTQPGFAGTPLVTLDGGSDASGFAAGFFLSGDDSTIRGFVDHRLRRRRNPRRQQQRQHDRRQLHRHGRRRGQLAEQRRRGQLVQGESDDNTIGGTGPSDRNVISGNGGYGIDLETGDGGDAGQQHRLGQLHRPQAGRHGHVRRHRQHRRRHPSSTATTTRSAARRPAARNYISANDDAGISIGGASNVVKGNTIGLDRRGRAGREHGRGHRRHAAQSSGGRQHDRRHRAGGGNVISGNSSDGIDLGGVEVTTVIAGNLIGTDPTGTSPIGNDGDGIHANDAAFTEDPRQHDLRQQRRRRPLLRLRLVQQHRRSEQDRHELRGYGADGERRERRLPRRVEPEPGQREHDLRQRRIRHPDGRPVRDGATGTSSPGT